MKHILCFPAQKRLTAANDNTHTHIHTHAQLATMYSIITVILHTTTLWSKDGIHVRGLLLLLGYINIIIL